MSRNASSTVVGGCLYALCATILWSGNFVVARALAGQLSPVEISFWRWGLSFLIILPFTWRSVWAHRRVIHKNKKLLLVMGLLGISLINCLNYKAGLTTQATNIALVATSAPVFMALIARFFLGEILSPQQVSGLVVALVGVVVLITGGILGPAFGPVLFRGRFLGSGGEPCCSLYTASRYAFARRNCRSWHSLR